MRDALRYLGEGATENGERDLARAPHATVEGEGPALPEHSLA